jgi:hypothetical protein
MAVTLPELCCLGRSRIVGVSDLDVLATVANRGGSKRAIYTDAANMEDVLMPPAK